MLVRCKLNQFDCKLIQKIEIYRGCPQNRRKTKNALTFESINRFQWFSKILWVIILKCLHASPLSTTFTLLYLTQIFKQKSYYIKAKDTRLRDLLKKLVWTWIFRFQLFQAQNYGYKRPFLKNVPALPIIWFIFNSTDFHFFFAHMSLYMPSY